MTKQSIARAWGNKVVACVCAATMAATMVAIPAFGGTQKAYAAADTTGYVTCAAYRAAESAPEILGLSGVSTNNAWSGLGALDWNAPFFYIMGTNINVNANPFMVNSVANYASGNKDAQPSMVFTQRQGGPMANMYAYGVNADSDAVWNMLPDVILGTGMKTRVDYSDAAYAPAAAAANGATDYNPIGINFDSTNIYTMIDAMYNLASAGDQIAAESNGAKQLRYGSATDIAKQFEKYVKGLQGYVLKNASAKKTVALVKNYDAASGTYELVPTGVAEGTATANRYLEAVQKLAAFSTSSRKRPPAACPTGVSTVCCSRARQSRGGGFRASPLLAEGAKHPTFLPFVSKLFRLSVIRRTSLTVHLQSHTAFLSRRWANVCAAPGGISGKDCT